MNRLLLSALLLSMLIMGSVSAYAEQRKSYKSPDGTLKAIIFSVDKKCSENRLEVRKSKGDLLIFKDYSSSDCEHGWVIEHAAWTPDSQFFVLSTSSSGGHQSWLSPTFCYSRRDNQIMDFADYLPAVAEAKFFLKAPDVMTVRVWTPLTADRNLERSIILPITFRLSDIRKGGERAREFLGE